MSADGWVKLWRKTLDSDVWEMSLVARAVFFWLLMSVNYKEQTTKTGQVVAPGEIITRYQDIARAVSPRYGKQITVKQIRGAIDGLTSVQVLDKIGHTGGQGGLHLKVLHWDTYQSEAGQTNGQGLGQTEGTKRAPIKEQKKERSTTVYTTKALAHFDEFWSLYPRKVGKGQARSAWAKATKLTDAQTIITGLRRLLPSLQQEDKQFIKHPSTWLNGECWTDEIATTITADDELDVLCKPN